MATERKFEVVGETDDAPEQTSSQAFAASAITLALKALSQRAAAAVKGWFALLTMASVFWLWNATPDPTYSQIVSLTIYAVIVLAANVIVRKV